MCHVLTGLDELAPNFALALAAHYRSLDVLRGFCQDGSYERSYETGTPRAIHFVWHFLGSAAPAHLKDLVRCELWAAFLGGKIDAKLEAELRRSLLIRDAASTTCIAVHCDVLELTQSIAGYLDTSFHRAGRLLWYCGVEPMYPVIEPARRPGLVAFQRGEDDVTMTFVPLDALRRADSPRPEAIA
jgi:hypothetical protein